MTTAPITFNTVPPILNTQAIYKVVTAFTGGAVGEIFTRINFYSTFNNADFVADIQPVIQVWMNHNTNVLFAISDIDINKLEFVSAGGDNTLIINAVNKVSSSLSTLNNTTNTLVSNVSSNLSSVINLNSSANTTLSNISSGIAQLNAVDATANIYLSGISTNLSNLINSISNENLTTLSIASGTSSSISNVRQIDIGCFSLLNTLLGGGVSINGVLFPVGIYRFDAHNKFGNNFVIGGTNANVAIAYTTAS